MNVKVEFSAEEFETALINPNNTLAEIHMPLLKVSLVTSLFSFLIVSIIFCYLIVIFCY